MTANPVQDHISRLRIILVDDDRVSSQKHIAQLKAAGESPLATTSDSWQQMFSLMAERNELARVLAIAVGTCTGYSLHGVLLALHEQNPTLPILLMNGADIAQTSGLPDSLNSRLLLVGEQSSGQQNLSSALRAARQLMGHDGQHVPSRLQSSNGSPLFRSLCGGSPAIRVLRDAMMQAAKRALTVLIIGETGTGKEVVARNLHYHGGRAGMPFRVVNCAAVTPETFAAELFGVQQSPASGRHVLPGLLEQANGGTILFDEIHELPLSLQAKLLRFLEDQSYQRAGGHELLTADVRVVAGTRANLLDQVAKGRFRDDLYYRISAMPLELPALRDRLEDIPELISELISSIESKGYESIRFNSTAIQSLQCHSWPGNVRELANLVERLSLTQPNTVVGINDLPPMYQYDPDLRQESYAEPPSEEDVAIAQQHAAEAHTAQMQAEADSAAATAAADNAINPMSLPLSEESLRRYLEKFEKQILEMAMHDCAGLLRYAADRMQTSEDRLQDRLREHGLAAAQ